MLIPARQRILRLISRCHRLLLAIAIAGQTATGLAGSPPTIPQSDDAVLEVLPTSFRGNASELRKLREQLAMHPNDADMASLVAKHYITIGSEEGDPRFFGYARAALDSWWNMSSPPATVLRLRAKLHEKDHQYDDALIDLDQLLVRYPRNAQAYIEMINIYRVQGRYDEAWQTHQRLETFAEPFVASLCRIPLEGATGNAERAYAEAERILPLAQSKWPSTVRWIVTMQAQLAMALGHVPEAEGHFKTGLKLTPNDRYLLREYADFLLDHGRAREVPMLLDAHTNDNGVLLSLSIAAHRLDDSGLARRTKKELQSRFDEIRLRGGDTHGKYEARFELEVKGNAGQALRIALSNWENQKDVRDSRNVLEAAIAANMPTAAQPVVDFLERHNTQDVQLQRLVQELKRQ
ncbi:MAG: tetratricopeptide repeat protein [Pirellulaceae bacterium]|nr:tetratricopeptide repeat protein [Planctomycetales bacterium]